MNYVKMFIAGIAFPSILLPFLLSFALLIGKPQVLMIPFLHFIPVLWGIWNILYFILFKKIFRFDQNLQLLVTGALLGLLVAILGVFWVGIPMALGIPSSWIYFPLLVAPILYAVVWLFIVHPINRLLGLDTFF